MEFKLLSEKDVPLWDQFVEESPQGSVFAKSFYLHALGFPYKIGALIKNETIQGGIVLIKNEINFPANPLFAKYLGVLTRPLAGKYVNRITAEKKIIESIVENIRSYKLFDYNFHPAFRNWLPFYWNGYRQELKYTYRFDDISDIERIKNNMSASTQNKLRKARNNNIKIDYNLSPEKCFQINRLTYQRQGGDIPYNYEYFKKFCFRLKESEAIRLMGAMDERGEYHAVCGIVYDSNCCYFIINGINHLSPNVGANSLLVLKAIEFASQVSNAFDFEGSMIKPVEQFYRGFGGILTPYYHIWKDNIINTSKHRLIRLYKKISLGK